MATPREFLKSLTADELTDIVDNDIAYNDSPEDPEAFDRTVIGLVERDYPEIAEMIVRIIERHVGPVAQIPENQLMAMTVPSMITLGAICRAAEARELPPAE